MPEEGAFHPKAFLRIPSNATVETCTNRLTLTGYAFFKTADTLIGAARSMFTKHFGLKEPGFSITPDPRYLFLTQEHREALAHLLYGAGEGGGFVLLTGEVGTGKTTVCRAFLEQVPPQVHVALILNPALTAPELLHTICNEFGIPVPEETDSTRVLLDKLNHYLLEAHACHQRPVLMIDEAQNLSPEVLEQIRLLTNLETHTHKLLQVFLIGQPELRDLLERKNLRQLAQRITARYHLMPLSRDETKGYIRHRLAVAGVNHPLFTPAALSEIHGLTGGVPRLINILCDRALLGAFATHKQQVDKPIVQKAASELKGSTNLPSSKRNIATPVSLFLLLAVFGAVALSYFRPLRLVDNAPVALSPASAARQPSVIERPPSSPGPAPEVLEAPLSERQDRVESAAQFAAAKASSPIPRPASEEDTVALPAEEKLDPVASGRPPEAATAELQILQQLGDADLERLTVSEQKAVARLLQLWIKEPLDPQAESSCDAVESFALLCRQGRSDWEKLIRYDRPALIRLTWAGGTRSGYALIREIRRTNAVLNDEGSGTLVPLNLLDNFWQGDFLLLWRPPPGGDLLIGPGSPEPYVRWLRQALVQIPGWKLAAPESGQFDSSLGEEVRRFQQQHGLDPDGLVGPETMIYLNTAADLPDTPRLSRLP